MELSSKNIIKINEPEVEVQLGQVVRETVEERLTRLLDAEADEVVKASRYERSTRRVDTRAGYYERNLKTVAGKVCLKVSKLRKITFESANIERYKRQESAVEEALMEMYLARVSVRRVDYITEALLGTRVSADTVSRLNQQIYKKIEDLRERPIEATFPYVYLDRLVMKPT